MKRPWEEEKEFGKLIGGWADVHVSTRLDSGSTEADMDRFREFIQLLLVTPPSIRYAASNTAANT